MSEPYPGAPLEALRVLLLTQDQMDYLWLAQMLARDPAIQWEINWISVVSDSQEQLRQESYDIIVWDALFHQDDSLTFLRFLSRQNPQTPVIALSADLSYRFVWSLFQAGAHECLTRRHLDHQDKFRCALSHAVFRQRQIQSRSSPAPGSSGVNRALFYEQLQQAILRAERREERVGLLFINIDEFRRINNSLGYRAGDELIGQVAARLRSVLRRSDNLARIGGDEFAIILDKVEHNLSLTRVAQKVQNVFVEPFSLSQQQVSLTVSMGLATYPDNGASADLLLRSANQAMFEAKFEHGNSYRFYNQQMNAEVSRQLALETDFRQALRGDQLILHYQPKVDVLTNRIVGMEALVRWQHPQLGLLGPGQFIGLAEKSGMVIPMGYWVIQRACADMERLARLGYEDLDCSVNLSFRQFFDKKLTETLQRIIGNAQIDTRRLEFELTESAMMFDREYTQNCLSQLHSIGIRFALDDFGTGYSSFSHLQRFPISTLKIDKSFIDNVTTNADDAILVRGIISLAHSLHMMVVAEGVETAEQLEFLRNHQCDQVQGYYFSPAVPLDAFVELLKKQERSLATKSQEQKKRF